MSSKNTNTYILTRNDISVIVRYYSIDKIMDDLIHQLTEAIQKFETDFVEIPARSGFHYRRPHLGLVEWMPILDKSDQAEATIKVVGYHPDNPKDFDLPTILSTISSYDTRTGHLKALTDGVFLTALRTGAASAVASKFLAKTDSTILGLIGCGAQAITQFHALSRVFNLKKIVYFDIDPAATASFQERCESLQLEIEFQPANIDQIVSEADILSTATSVDVGAGPLFQGYTPKPHLHINAVGSDFPGKVEIPQSFLRQSFVCPDFIEQALVEGECQQLSREDIDASLSELVKAPSQFSQVKSSYSVFDSTGWALEDKVVMNLFIQYAKKIGVGQQLEIESTAQDSKNPYGFFKLVNAVNLLEQIQKVNLTKDLLA